MIEISLDRVLLEDGNSVFDLALTDASTLQRDDVSTVRARLDRDSLVELKGHIEGLLLDTTPESIPHKHVHESHQLNPNSLEYVCLYCDNTLKLDQPCKQTRRK